MPPFVHDCIDPTPEVVESKMAEAVESANKRCRVGKMEIDRDDYRRFLAKEFAGGPEGVGMWLADRGRVQTYPVAIRATLLGLAWWTSPLGKRQVRIVGRRIEPYNNARSNRFGPPNTSWPALCHLDPDAVVARTFAGGKPEAVVLCACGALGTAAQLGWMSDTCGPCHDHGEEHGRPLPAAGGPYTLSTGGAAMYVAFSASGKTIVAAAFGSSSDYEGGTGSIRFWDRKTGKLRKEHSHEFFLGKADLPFVATGKRVLVDGYELSAVFDQETGKEIGVSSSADVSYPVAHRDGWTLAAFGPDEGGMVTREIDPDDEWAFCFHVPDGEDHPTALAFAPDGKSLASGRGEGRVDLHAWPGGESRSLSPAEEDGLGAEQVHALAFSPDGKSLAAGTRADLADSELEFATARPQSGHVLLYDLEKGKVAADFRSAEADIHSVAFSPDGKLLFAGDSNGAIRVFDAVKREEVVMLGGHLGPVNGLTFSPRRRDAGERQQR